MSHLLALHLLYLCSALGLHLLVQVLRQTFAAGARPAWVRPASSRPPAAASAPAGPRAAIHALPVEA
jgi:hypothetical protein